MVEPKSTFCRSYANNKLWDPNLVEHILISKDLIKTAINIVYKQGMKVKIINPENPWLSENDYLFQGNFVRINHHLSSPDIELHSETEKGLAKLIKELGLPDK